MYSSDIDESQARTWLRHGRGAGALSLLSAPRERAHHLLLDLVGHDPRDVGFLESRAEYCAYIAARTRLDVDRLESLLRIKAPRGRDASRLCTQTLGVLAVRGDRRAVAVLADSLSYAADPWDAMRWLVRVGSTEELVDACVVVEDRCDDPIDRAAILRMLPDNVREEWFVVRPGLRLEWHDIDTQFNPRESEPTDEQWRSMLQDLPFDDLLGRGHHREPWRIELLVEAGRRDHGDGLMRHLVRILDDRSRPTDPVQYTRRLNARRMMPYLSRRELLPVVHDWCRSISEKRRTIAFDALSLIAEREDLHLLEALWEESRDLPRGRRRAQVRLASAFGRIAIGRTHPQLLEAYEQFSNSCARSVAAGALSRTSPEFSALHAYECLWDCEPKTRAAGIGAIAPAYPGVEDRLAEIRMDPMEHPGVLRAMHAS